MADDARPNRRADLLEKLGGPSAIADVISVRAADRGAREARAVIYSELLGRFGHRFSRPKMRPLCRTLDTIDTTAATAGKPALAVPVVRESDGLPGQGWWTARVQATGHRSPWTGLDARRFVDDLQQLAFAYWR